MKWLCLLAAIIIYLSIGTISFAQGTNASLSGTVTDAAQAAVPGATITAQNVKTGVITNTETNASGVYVFPSLQPGTYRVTAERQGFKKVIHNEVVLELYARITLNYSLEVATISENIVEINAALDTRLAIGNTSVGGVINGQKVQDLPLPSRDALGLVLTQAGIVGDNFAGARIGALNVARDGINVMDQRLNGGVNSVIFNSVDVVDEVRVITSPADAEFGRGSGQVLITTKSGTNEFHGSVFESHRNTALTANDFFNNLRGNPRNVLIRNQFGGRLGGPIIKNKTFFFAGYEAQREVSRDTVTSTTYTQQARQGIFRFFPGARNANAIGQIPTVDLNGNPVRPSTATGNLQSVNLFERDANRLTADQSGIVRAMLDLMPLPNDFRDGDGLNTAGFTWSRPESANRDQIYARFDHVFTENHRFNFNYTWEKEFFLNGFLEQPYPDSPGGTQESDNQFYSLGLTSTLSPSLVNEFRAGAQRARFRFYAPWELDEGRTLMPRAGDQIFGINTMLADEPIDFSNDPQGRISPLYSFSDTLSWSKGRHGFKGGVEFRFVSTNGFNSFTVLPRANFGAGGQAVSGINSTAILGLGMNEAAAQNLLIDLTGSLQEVEQAFNASGGSNNVFLAGEGKQRTWRQREFSFFFKDDFKVRPSLTLNLGVRYEFYGVPHEANGKTAGLAGGSAGLFGLTGSSFADLYQPGRLTGSPTQVILVGKHSPNEDINLYNNDLNNFAPAVGFSWAIPYFGENKTVLRMGYGIGYERNSLRILDVVAGDQPGLRTVREFTTSGYLDLSRVGLPLTPLGNPLDIVGLTDRSQTVRAFDTNLRTPYVQNWNVTLQRELFKNFTLDFRYVGNKGTKLIRGTNINEVNIFETGILEAYKAVQAGGESALLDRIFNGLDMGSGIINGTTVRAGASLRSNPNTRAFFANNNVGGFANYLNTTSNFTDVPGGLLRNGNLPENFIIGNPQFLNANLTGNFANSTYHSFQIELNKRYSNGWTLQSNYTWSKALGEEEGAGQEMNDNYRNGRDRRLDKRLLSFHRPHVWRTSAVWEMPFGPGRRLLGKSNKVISRLVELWQFGAIYNVFTGAPLNLSTGTTTSGITSFNQFTDTTPMLMGNLPKGFGKVKRVDNGVVYFDGLQEGEDPSIANITSSQGLRGRSTLVGIADTNGNLILANPVPGRLGSLVPFYLQGPGSYRLDLNLVKRIQIREKANFEMRIDAINAFNTPEFDPPNGNINSTDFGRITGTNNDARIVVVSLRINF
jgi:Carboxypeptidase regulatory-like domain/TonB dependent receptor